MSSRNEAKLEESNDRSTHRSAAHSTVPDPLCPIVQLPLSESPREPLQNSLSRHRGQLIGPPAASAGTSLEYPSKSVAGARYVDLRQSPRSSNEDHRGLEGISLFLQIVLVSLLVTSSKVVYISCTYSWGNELVEDCEKQVRIRYHTSRRNSPLLAISGPRSVEETLARIGDTTRLLSAKG